MEDKDKTKGQLINELAEMRQRVAELETSEAARLPAEQAGRRTEFQREAAPEALREHERGIGQIEVLVEKHTAELEAANRQLREITERKRAEEALTLRLEQLAALSQASQAVTVSLEVDQVLAKILSLTSEVTASDYATVLLVDEAGHIGQSTEDLPGVPSIEYRARNGGLTDWIVRSGQAVVIDEIGEDGVITSDLGEGAPRFANPHIVEAGIKSVAGLPLIAKENLLGVLYLHSLRSGAFRGQLSLLTTFANQAAIAVENARLYEAVRQELTERKQVEEALRASEEYARSIIDSSLDTIIAVDMERRIIEFNRAAQEIFGYRAEEILGKHIDILYVDPQEGFEVHQMTINEGQCVREVSALRKNGEVFPSLISASALRDAHGELVGVMGVSRDVTERKRAEEAIQRRNRELALLNRASRTLASTLDLDQILSTVLEEVRRLMDVIACSVWLTEPETDELVCLQSTGPGNEIVRGWRLAPGQGICGWVARHGESLIVPDVWADERYFNGVDRRTELGLRSILTVPLRVKQNVIGVLQVLATEVGRFSTADLELLEPLAASAAIAIENARLYEQARQDAETKSTLLREVNHRVKNNLTAIIGLLHAERSHAKVEDQAIYQPIMQNLVNRVQGLSTVHSMLSASEWASLSLSELTAQIIRSTMQTLPRDKRLLVDVAPSSVRVTPDQAHNLALVINELVTDAIKYGMQERNTARIAVRIKLDEGMVLFEFRDDGPGYPEDVLQLERHGVGFDLIQNIVRQNLRGELKLYNDRGAAAAIRFEAQA